MVNIDKQYNFVENRRVQHGYGLLYPSGSKGAVEIIHTPLSAGLLATFCNPKTKAQDAVAILPHLYSTLIDAATNYFPLSISQRQTRMGKYVDDKATITSQQIEPIHIAVSAVLRAGALPAKTVEDILAMVPNVTVYNDWITAERQTDGNGVITGTAVTGKKLTSESIPADAKHRICILPDPMGATGSTSVQTMETYNMHGVNFNGVFALHLIITPEYVRKMAEKLPDVRIIALRCDRGLSESDVLETRLGRYPKREIGLTEKGYIVPGGGDIGMLLSVSEGLRID